MKLGKLQIALLGCLNDHGSWNDSGKCGWIWDTHSNTKKIFDSLVNRGFVKVTDGCYTLTKAGKSYQP